MYFNGDFKNVAELVRLCKDMRAGDKGNFKYVGGNPWPSTTECHYALNSEERPDHTIFFHCDIDSPPYYAVYCYS